MIARGKCWPECISHFPLPGRRGCIIWYALHHVHERWAVSWPANAEVPLSWSAAGHGHETSQASSTTRLSQALCPLQSPICPWSHSPLYRRIRHVLSQSSGSRHLAGNILWHDFSFLLGEERRRERASLSKDVSTSFVACNLQREWNNLRLHHDTFLICSSAWLDFFFGC